MPILHTVDFYRHHHLTVKFTVAIVNIAANGIQHARRVRHCQDARREIRTPGTRRQHRLNRVLYILEDAGLDGGCRGLDGAVFTVTASGAAAPAGATRRRRAADRFRLEARITVHEVDGKRTGIEPEDGDVPVLVAP
ncbi:hypothetical protein D3C76_563570 [compost metagenome]